ncbi:MAG: hypothetical protein AAF447_12415 [Myxococcota bacterium]
MTATSPGHSAARCFRFRIEADGTTSRHTLVSATNASLAAACLTTLMETRFTSARTREGEAVPVDTPFLCTFEVEGPPRRDANLRRGV